MDWKESVDVFVGEALDVAAFDEDLRPVNLSQIDIMKTNDQRDNRTELTSQD